MDRRFLTLDAMRGVAALAVFTIHAGVLISPLVLSHAWLAVDLFFLLSGFVIDRAYGAKLASGTMDARRFIMARYVRLLPLYLLGTLVGIASMAISLLLGQGVMSVGQFLAAAGSALLMLPSPTWGSDAFLVPANYPAWSLLFELAINIAFALCFRWLTTRLLVAITLLSLAGLIYATIVHGTVNFGAEWLFGWWAFARVGFSFTLGVLIHRHANRDARTTPLAILLPLATIPLFLGTGGAIGDLAKIVLVFPALVLIAIRIEPSRPRLAVLLGTLSYPLYVIHIPLIQFVERALTVLHVDKTHLGPWGGLLLGALLIAAALAADHFYDLPVRRWLTRRLGLTGRRSVPAVDKGL